MDLGPIGYNVQLDQAAASSLAAEFRTTASLLEEQRHSRSRLASTARADWRGAWAEAFDEWIDVSARDATRLASAMADAAVKLDALAADARREQARREMAREWQRRQDERSAREKVEDFFMDPFVENDPPPGGAIAEPRCSIDPPRPAARDHGPPTVHGVGGGCGISSARPDDLDGWARASSAADSVLQEASSSLTRAHGRFVGSLGWGHFDASSLLLAFADYIRLNREEVAVVIQIASAFRAAGGSGAISSLPDIAIQAALDAVGLTAGRPHVTFDDPIAWGEPPTSGFSNDPINTGSGNFVESETDMTFMGLVQGLDVSRTYNSRSTRLGPFGPGWASWATTRLSLEPNGAHFESCDGQRAVFPATKHGYEQAPSVTGLVARTNEGSSLSWFGGDVWEFDSEGLLIRIDRGPGTEIRLGYEEGRLVEMVHENGKKVSFAWTNDRIVAATSSDGRRVEYRYDDRGSLIEASGPDGRRHYQVDEGGRVIAVIDGDDVEEARNTYDADGRVLGQTSRVRRKVRLKYLPGAVTVVDDDDGGPVNTYIHDDEGRLTALIDGHGHRTSRMYDGSGNPISVTDRKGATSLQEWDERSRLTRLRDPAGTEFTFSYDRNDRLVLIACNGAEMRYRYEGRERVPSEITDPSGETTRFEVEHGLVKTVIDPDGVETRLTYDADGNILTVSDAAGRTTSYERGPSGQAVAITSPSGRRTRFGYDASGQLAQRTEPDGATWAFERSPAGRLLAVVDPEGGRLEFRRGGSGEIAEIVDPLERVSTLITDPLENVTSLTTADGGKWQFTYDGLCRLTGIHDPSGGTWLREYDAEGTVVGVVDPIGGQSTSKVDDIGRVTEMNDGVASMWFAYDHLGHVVWQKRADGSERRFTYDACGRCASVKDPEGGVTRFAYTPGGRLSVVTSPMGNATHFRYDACGRLIAHEDPLGFVWTYSYDDDGLLSEILSPTGEVERHEYDEAGRLARHAGPIDGLTTYTYDRLGRVVQITDARGGVQRFAYDAAGQVTEAIDANGGVTRFSYDEGGSLLTITDPLGGTITRTYDEVGRLLTESDQLGRSTHLSYDAAGRLIEQRDANGDRRTWVYDAAGRVSALGADDLHIRIHRDATGRPLSVTEPATEHRLTWDGSDRLTSRARDGLALGWRHDHEGRVVGVTFPDGGEATYRRDPAGRLIEISHPGLGKIAMKRDASGRLTEMTGGEVTQRWSYADGKLVRHEVDQDGRLRVTELERDKGGKIVRMMVDGAATRFDYDRAGQLTHVEDPEATWSFEYDAAGRLVAELSPSGKALYSYDAAGQIVECLRNGSSTRFGYDAAGRRVSEEREGWSRRYSWDGLDRLVGIDYETSGGKKSTRLTVDAFGDLADVDGIEFLWDAADGIPELRWMGGKAALGDGVPWALVAAGEEPVYLAPGWQGSVTETDPWGDDQSSTAPPQPHLSYRGELALNGLIWLRNRVYDPATRSFLSPDPLEGVVGTPWVTYPYNYAGNDPIGSLDPLGLRPVTDAEIRSMRGGGWLSRVPWGDLVDGLDIALDVLEAQTTRAMDVAGAKLDEAALALANATIKARKAGGTFGARLYRDIDELRADFVHRLAQEDWLKLRSSVERLKLLGKAMPVLDVLVQYHDSYGQSRWTKLASGVAASAATIHPIGFAFDVASGGTLSHSVDALAVLGEAAFTRDLGPLEEMTAAARAGKRGHLTKHLTHAGDALGNKIADWSESGRLHDIGTGLGNGLFDAWEAFNPPRG